MKKLLLSALALAVVIGTANAQIYFSEDFGTATGNPIPNWTTTDQDGDTYDWLAADVTGNINSTGSSAISNSWNSTAGPLTPNNYMTTTVPINLGSATAATSLFWTAGNVETTNNWWEENYSVYLTTSNTITAINAATPVFTEVLPSGGTMLSRSVNVGAYAGQTVYLTFRHHNCTDENFLIIDDIELREVLPNDAEMTSLSVPAYVVAGMTNITGTVTNMGSSTITAMDIVYDAGAGPQTDVLTGLNIAAGATYNFTHATQLNVAAGTTYNLTVDVVLTGDANAANNSLSTAVAGLTSVPAKTVVGEEKTGTWCGWCPRGAVGLAGMESTPSFIGIAVHNSDPMTISAYDGNIGTYVPGGYPGGGVDRVIDGDPSQFSSMHAQRVSAIVPCQVNSINAVFNSSTNQISVSTVAEFFGNIPGNYRLSCVIVEDDLQSTASGWAQTNYYSGGGNGSMAFPAGINGGYDFATGTDPAAAAAFGGYDHTARSLSNNDILGNSGSLPAGNVPMGTHNYTFTDVATSSLSGFANAGFDWTKAHAIVMVVNASTGEILNAKQEPLSMVTSVEDIADAKFKLNVYPNPTQEDATITFNLDAANTVKMEVYNAMGSLVYTENAGSLNAGNHQFTFDGTDLNSGFYFVNLTVGDKVITQKVSLLK